MNCCAPIPNISSGVLLSGDLLSFDNTFYSQLLLVETMISNIVRIVEYNNRKKISSFVNSRPRNGNECVPQNMAEFMFGLIKGQVLKTAEQ